MIYIRQAEGSGFSRFRPRTDTMCKVGLVTAPGEAKIYGQTALMDDRGADGVGGNLWNNQAG